MEPTHAIFEELGFDSQRVQAPKGAVVYSIARTYGLIMRKLASLYHRFGLSSIAFNLLLLLERGKDPQAFTQRYLGERLVVSPSDMSGLVDRLERRGLVRRTPGKDRRSHLLEITPKGSALVAAVWPSHAEVITRLGQAVAPADVPVILRVLTQLRASMGLENVPPAQSKGRRTR